jgi:signal peptidase I
MGHDYHGIVIREAQRLWREDISSKIQNRPDYLAKVKYFSDSLIKTVPDKSQINYQMLDKVSRDIATEFYSNIDAKSFINNLEFWKSRARKMIAIDKLTQDNDGVIIEHGGIVYRPVDKRENYIKRCVGIPGDWLEIKKSILYVNGKPAFVAENQNLEYSATNFTPKNEALMREKYGLEVDRQDYVQTADNEYSINVTKSELTKLKRDYPQAKFELKVSAQYSDTTNSKPTGQQMLQNLECYPKDPYVNNTVTDFTKFQIPFKGQTIKIDKSNIAWFRRIITAYEGHTLKETKNGIFIDGKITSTYTFAMNYYWLMGDNRYKSADSRIWGFVPEDHIVGKASLVWFSKSVNYGIRWERLFNVIK